MVGKTLGHYEILEPLGAGGMGEVYRARDTTLDRHVAIKVLPEDFAADPDRLARFEREAKLLAALSHANIGSIYGLEESDDIRFLVLELIEGETLERRLQRGAIPVPAALDIARQIAEALEAAHDEGIIHRDVKPANVLLTAKGGVKVLDFGIAKRTALDGAANAKLTEQATSLTVDGTLMGTPPYMSPEQIRGEEAAKRADIWAFGCVVYEMLTGKAAFARETVADTLVAVLEAEPDWEALPNASPTSVRSTLARCLRKDSQRRLRDIGDAKIEIEEAVSHPDPAIPGSGRVAPARRPILPWAITGLVVVASALLVWNLSGWSPGVELRPLRFDFDLPDGVATGRRPLAISHDGSRVAYEAQRRIFLWEEDSGESRVLPNTDPASNPFFSPDGNWIGFFAEGELRKVAVSGGLPETITTIPGLFRGAVWTEDDQIVFSYQLGGLRMVSADGGEVEILSEHEWWQPEVLPGGRVILGARVNAPYGPSFSADEATITALRLEDRSETVVLKGGYMPRYVSPGYLVFVLEGTLRAVAFDADTAQASGQSVEMVPGVHSNQRIGNAAFAVSESGTLVYAPGGPESPRDLVFVDRRGNPLGPAWDEPMAFESVRASPDGQALAVMLGWHNHELWVISPDGDTRELLNEGDAHNPTWTATGSHILFGLNPFVLSRVASTGGDTEPLTPSAVGNPQAVSSDGKTLIFYSDGVGGTNDLWALPLGGEGEPTNLTATGANERAADLHPDGTHIAYQSNPSEGGQIYVAPYPQLEPATRVSAEGGTLPRWGPGGRELFYRNGREIWAVGFDAESGIGTPVRLFEMILRGSFYPYDIMPDGERFVVITAPPSSPVTQINVILNWFEELKQRVPTGR